MLIVNTPLRKVLLTINEVDKCEVRIYECSKRVNLIGLHMENYDVIWDRLVIQISCLDRLLS